MPLFLLGTITGVYLWKTIYLKCSEKDLVYCNLIAILFTAIGISIKLSFAAFGGLASLIIIVISLKYIFTTQKWPLLRKFYLWPIFFASCMILPWVLCELYFSGYPAYPISAGSFNVAWKVPKEKTIEMVKVVKAYNRDPGGNINKVLSSQIWLKPWLQHVSHSLTFVCPILFLIVGLFLCIWHYIRKEESIFKLRSLLLFMFPSAISALFWFITAPEPYILQVRYFRLLSAGLLVPVFIQINSQKRRYLIFLSISFIILPIFLSIGFKIKRIHGLKLFIRYLKCICILSILNRVMPY